MTALAIRRAVLGRAHPDIAIVLQHLGNLYLWQDRPAVAERYLRRALAIRQKALGDDHPATAMSLNDLGATLRDRGRPAQCDEARRTLEQALEIRKRRLLPDRPNSPQLALSFYDLGALLRRQGDAPTAREYLEHALDIQERVLHPQHVELAATLAELGQLLVGVPAEREAGQDHLQRALAIYQAHFGPAHPRVRRTQDALAALGRQPDSGR